MNKTNTSTPPTLPSYRLMLGDCRRVLATFPSGCIDLVVCDPPYLVDYRDRSGRTLRGDAGSDPNWIAPAFEQIHRVMKPDSLCVSFYGWTHMDTFMQAFRAAGLSPVGHLVFCKSYTSGTRFTQRRHEQALLLAKGRPALPENPLPDVLPWGPYTGNKLHPTQKPVELLQRLVRAYSKPGDLVLDPFCGSGSTLMAAREEGRRSLGIEVDPRVFQVAKARMTT